MHKKKNNKTIAKAISLPVERFAFTLFASVIVYLALCSMAFAAAELTPMGDVLCTVVDFVIYGNLGRGLATLAIIILGVGALLGKASWGLAMTVGIGISVVFGAPDIVTSLTGFPDYCA